MSLQTGAVTSAEFEAALEGQYDIGIEMDGTIAARLFPCTADTGLFGGDCVGPRLPASLKISVFSDDVDVSHVVSRSTSTAGGSYWRDGGRETYVWPAAFLHLSPGKHYRVNVQSMIDGSSVAVANPMLRIAANSTAGEGESVFRALIFVVALASLVMGAVLMLVALIVRRGSR